MWPRTAMASRNSPVPSFRAASAGTGAAKNTHTCAPIPDLDTSNPAGTDHARAAFTYANASNIAECPSKSAANHRHRSPSSSGYNPIYASPARWPRRTSLVNGRYSRSSCRTPLRHPPRTAGTQPALPVRAFSHRTA